MGARQSRSGYDQWDLNELEQVSGLPAQQIQQLQQEFFQAAGRDGVLDRNEFANVYARFSGGQNVSQQQIARVFQTFDRDQSGSLSFDEFLSAAVMMNRNVPRQNRLDYVIRQNNHHGRQQGDGRISAQYGHQVFRRLNDYYGLPPGAEHQCWKQVDQQNRGYVSQNEFMNYISQQDVYNRRYQ
ncbi:unnamed protein product [Adineta steineri]|uniref:EF-hand domain-containing protein n=1 Tax=Adineta steineri TaxID=433720 RepID=A0A819C232_9BILA|nr:unnamed protein product [Adineta steineri]CAF3807269.1 unnamed protein product [Adineta steineri]